MHVNSHSDFVSLAPLASTWNELADGVPFRRWEWVEAWWRHYGCDENGQAKRNRELFVLTVWDDNEQLMAIAPWHKARTKSGANIIRFLGDGEVCSDYVTVLSRPGQEDNVAEALADWLTVRNQNVAAANSDSKTNNGQLSGTKKAVDHRWDRLEFIGVTKSDVLVNRLLALLEAEGNVVHHGNPLNSWRVALPASWEEFLMILSKQHRNRLRHADKLYFQTGKVQLRYVETQDEVANFFDILVKLHQGRWEQRGLPGAFASPQFQAFHREISARLFADGRATLSWLEMDGKPLAVEYRLHGDGVMYAYQSGMDPERLQIKPGELANMAAIKNAIERKQHSYDLLRGDETYKAHWRATPQPLHTVRVVPRHLSARLRHNAWVAGKRVKRWIKTGLETAGHWLPRSKAPSQKVSQ